MRDVIFVVGMGRSGTSALTRVLSLCGAALPRRLLASNDSNPTGHWESQDAIDVNAAFLHARGSSWYDPGLRLQIAGVAADERRAFIRQIRAVFVHGFDEQGPIVLKDPRITGLLPYWTAAAAEVGLRVTIVHIVRNPDDVTASLDRRERLDDRRARALWLKYNLVGERDGRRFPRLIVSYEDVLNDWRAVVGAAVRELGVSLAISAASATAVDGFLNPGLHHHAAPAGKLVDDFTAGSWVRRTYALLDGARQGALPSVALDAIWEEYTGAIAYERRPERLQPVRPQPAVAR